MKSIKKRYRKKRLRKASEVLHDHDLRMLREALELDRKREQGYIS